MARLRHAMIDLETVGLKANAAIVSIGVVLFDPVQGIISRDNFYSELDWNNQNRFIDKETQKWWERQPAKARDALYGIDDLEDVLKELAEWLPADVKVWGNGPTFDITKLEHAYDQHKIKIPWEFWNIRDCRTVKNMYESTRGGFDKKSGGTLHNALDDAYYQAWYICFMWVEMLGNKNGGKVPSRIKQ